MKQEKVRDFTRRISQSNRGGLVVVIYDIIFAYMDEAQECFDTGDYEGFRDALRKAQRGVSELAGALNFRYDISKELYPLYVFAKEEMAKAIVKKSADALGGVREVLANLRDAFVKAAAQDRSKPLMSNAQQVYAGFTYGKNDLNETYQDLEATRGFFA